MINIKTLSQHRKGFLFLGPVAKWSGIALQKLLQRFEPARDLRKKVRS